MHQPVASSTAGPRHLISSSLALPSSDDPPRRDAPLSKTGSSSAGAKPPGLMLHFMDNFHICSN